MVTQIFYFCPLIKILNLTFLINLYVFNDMLLFIFYFINKNFPFLENIKTFNNNSVYYNYNM